MTTQAFITGKDLRQYRKEAKLTTAKMAQVAGVKTRKTYENWEAEKSFPDMNQLLHMLIAMNVDPVEFIKNKLGNVETPERNH